MATFALVHGGSHGAWCWEPLVAELERRGHDTVAMDLPIDRPEAGLNDHARVAADACTREPDFMVGHSLAGSFLPLAAARAGAGRMVFLCAMIAVEGKSLADQQAEAPDMVRMPYGDTIVDEWGRTLATRAIAKSMYYSACTEEQIDWAVPRLRPQAPTLRMARFPAGGWPSSIPSTYIMCTEDAVVSPDWSERASRERLGVDAIKLAGDHSPFVSRPAELADALVGLIARP